MATATLYTKKTRNKQKKPHTRNQTTSNVFNVSMQKCESNGNCSNIINRTDRCVFYAIDYLSPQFLTSWQLFEIKRTHSTILMPINLHWL